MNKKLVGAFDLLFLFGRGIGAFEGKKAAALRSLLIPLVFFPLSLLFSYFYPPKGMETGFPAERILLTVGAQYIVSFIFSLALVAGLARALGKQGRFWLFLEASNWVGVAMNVVTLPLVLAAVFGWLPREQMDRIFVIVALYGYLVTACVAYRSFQVNWQLAGFIAVATFFAGQATWDLLFWAQGIPQPW